MYDMNTKAEDKAFYFTSSRLTSIFADPLGLMIFNTLPLDSLTGLLMTLVSMHNRDTVVLYDHRMDMTAQEVCKGLQLTRPQTLLVPPQVLKMLIERREDVKKTRVLQKGCAASEKQGSFLDELGKVVLRNYGFPLKTLYGL